MFKFFTFLVFIFLLLCSKERKYGEIKSGGLTVSSMELKQGLWHHKPLSTRFSKK